MRLFLSYHHHHHHSRRCRCRHVHKLLFIPGVDSAASIRIRLECAASESVNTRITFAMRLVYVLRENWQSLW